MAGIGLPQLAAVLYPSPGALGPGSRLRRRYAKPPAGALLTGLGAGELARSFALRRSPIRPISGCGVAPALRSRLSLRIHGLFATMDDRITDDWPEPAGLGPPVSARGGEGSAHRSPSHDEGGDPAHAYSRRWKLHHDDIILNGATRRIRPDDALLSARDPKGQGKSDGAAGRHNSTPNTSQRLRDAESTARGGVVWQQLNGRKYESISDLDRAHSHPAPDGVDRRILCK